MNTTTIKRVIATTATTAKSKWSGKNYKSAAELIEEAGWVEDDINHWDFIPVISNDMFADITKMLLDGNWREVSGNFYIDPSSQEVEYISLAESVARANAMAVDLDAEGAVKRLMDDRQSGIEPNGQWHTHPFGSAFWSQTDVKDQIKDITLASAFIDEGERYFMCVGQLHITVRRVRWDKSGVRYIDSPAYLPNGRQLAPSKSRYYYNTQPVTGMADDSLVKGVDDILDIAPLMARDPDLHRNLSIFEKNRILNLVNARYGNLYKLTEYLNTITITEAVNKVFSMYGVELGNELLSDKTNHELIGLLEGKEVDIEHEEIIL